MSVAFVSVVLPTYNRRDRLEKVLHALESQTYSRDGFEVVVVSDGATDDTNDFMRAYKSAMTVSFVEQRNQGVAVARNAGVGKARGDLILFVDDDVVPCAELIAEHVRSHVQDDLAIMGPMLTPDDFVMQPWVEYEQLMLMKQYTDIQQGRWTPTAKHFYTGNTSVARRHIVAAGGFDPAFRRAEDVELAFRLARHGVQFRFNPRAIGWHHAERSFGSWKEIAYAYGRNDVIFTRDKGEASVLPTVFRDFHLRHPMIRGLATLCVGRSALASPALAAFTWAARIPRLSRFAFSAIFNLRYYQGLADELGGRQEFLRRVRESR